MRTILRRFGLILYGILSIIEAVANLAIYVTLLDTIIPPLDVSLPFHFWYHNRFLKGSYIANLKKTHG